MKDLTIAATLKRVRKLFPDKSCFVRVELWEFSHLETYEQPNPERSIYIEGLSHFKGKNFRNILKQIQERVGDK